jgi:hypothetical protein
MKNKTWRQWSWLFLLGLASGATSAQDQIPKLTVQWNKVTRVSQTAPTLQVVVSPLLRRGSPIHDKIFQALGDLQADYVRYVPWRPYPKLGIAELEPPGKKTSWDFSLIDPMTIDFLNATKGHPVIMNFSTIPQWMFKMDKPIPYPSDPDQVVWDYGHEKDLRDPSGRDVADYFARLVSWYTQGGFTDELGKRHESGYHFSIPYWEVLNEVEYDTPENYTRTYDAIVEAIRRVQPDMKFVGMALASPDDVPQFIEYFLDHKNHKPGIPLDFISYHFYVIPDADESPETQAYTFFAKAEAFVRAVKYIELMRKRLSPETRTTIDEIGGVAADDAQIGKPGHPPLPDSFWSLVSAMYAYIFGESSRLGIDAAGVSQLVGYPTQYPSVTMLDWETGKPNPRYWSLKLLCDNFGPGGKVVESSLPGDAYVYSLAEITRDGKRRLLLVNKRNRTTKISVPGASGGQQDYVDQTTGYQPPASRKLTSDVVELNGFAVSAVTLP